MTTFQNLTRIILPLLFLLVDVRGEIINDFGSIKQGRFRYHYDDTMGSSVCSTVVMIAVGTAMSVPDYDELGAAVSTGKPIVTVITDHNPNFFVKLSDKKYANFYNAFLDNLGDNIPICKGKSPKILAGAHSASGQAAINAFPKLDRKPDGFIGLDPFEIKTRKMTIDPSIPTLEWGFKETTCAVKVDNAAKAAYEITSDKHRVFYRVENKTHKVAHCAFTDKGCSIVCGKKKDGKWVIGGVAASIHAFIDAIKTGSSAFTSTNFDLSGVVEEGLFDLYVQTETP